jgi:hypothetical protein
MSVLLSFVLEVPFVLPFTYILPYKTLGVKGEFQIFFHFFPIFMKSSHFLHEIFTIPFPSGNTSRYGSLYNLPSLPDPSHPYYIYPLPLYISPTPTHME